MNLCHSVPCNMHTHNLDCTFLLSTAVIKVHLYKFHMFTDGGIGRKPKYVPCHVHCILIIVLFE